MPRLIDSNSRMGEYLMVFMIPLFLLRTLDPVFALVTGALACVIYVRTSAGKPDGYLAHLLYRRGLPLSGLLHPKLRTLIP